MTTADLEERARQLVRDVAQSAFSDRAEEIVPDPTRHPYFEVDFAGKRARIVVDLK
jgi:hypothetical protein